MNEQNLQDGAVSQTTYTMSEFFALVAEAYKRMRKDLVLTGLSVNYPSDSRCAYRLCVFTQVDEDPDTPVGKHVFGGMFDTTKPDSMRELFNDPSVVSTEWHRKPDAYVTIVRQSGKTIRNNNASRTPKEALCEIADRLSYLFGKMDGTFDPPALKEIYEIACEALGRTWALTDGKKDKK